MEKKLSKSKPKLKAWKAFSSYIRLRDCVKTMGNKDYGQCFTCGVIKERKSLQAGHFVDSRCNAILFVEEIVNAQCVQCNFFKSGNKDRYTPKMVAIWGIDRVEEFQNLKNIVKEYSIEDYLEIERIYKDKFIKLYKEN